MGDRAIIQMKNGDEFSPVLYLHWSGSDVKRIICDTKDRMKDRHDDMSYAFARLVQIAIGASTGAIGYGVWNQVTSITKEDSHGDAGCFLIDVSNPEWPIETFGGYGLDGEGEEEIEDED